MSDLDIPGLSDGKRLPAEKLVEDIPAMPVVAQRVMKELGNERTTAPKVAELIAMDQAMTSRILRIANSPVFGARKQISTVSQALVVIGFSAMKGLVITVSTRGVYKQAGLLEQLLWEHSIGCAVAATEIARATRAYSPDEAFIGGLMHDIGRAIFASAYRDDYEAMFQYIYNKGLGRSALIELETRYFGITHMQIGEQVALKWNLSQATVEMIGHHHELDGAGLDALKHPEAAAVAGLANIVCQHLGVGMRVPDTEAPLYDSAFSRRLGLNEERIAEILGQTLEMFEHEKATFSF